MKNSLCFLVVVVASIILSACGNLPSLGILPTDEPPGVGERADKGYAFSEPIVAALEEYRLDHGMYPDKLVGLVPDYLPIAPAATDELDFSYSSMGESYSFSFHYTGPGMNTCTYKPGQEWDCSGAF